VAGAAKSRESWVEPFLGEAGFIQAWVADVEYDYWQNATDPLQYESAGRSYAHLPMKSNDLPPPLRRNIIDISKNPGRCHLKAGYVEAISATMWLGERFCQRVGKGRKAKVLSDDRLNARALNNVIALRVLEHCFCDGHTAQVQNQLREILYGPET